MNLSRHTPAAITGMGLICRRHYPLMVPHRFIFVDALPELPAAERERAGAWLSSRSMALACGAAYSAAEGNSLLRESCGAAITISKGLIERLEEGVEHLALEGPGARAIPAISACSADAADSERRANAAAGRSRRGGSRRVRERIGERQIGHGLAARRRLPKRAGLRGGELAFGHGAAQFRAAGRDQFTRSDAAVRCAARWLRRGRRRGGFRLEDARRAAFNAERGTGPRVLGTILSVALGSDAHHLTAPDMSGEMLARVVEIALLRAGLEPDQVGWIHAHGTATAYNDTVEIAALRKVFGRRIPPVTATKGATGHLLGASGAVALGLSLEALRASTIPCIAGLESPAAEFEGVDFVIGAPRRSSAKIVLVLNHGFGGHIAAALVGI